MSVGWSKLFRRYSFIRKQQINPHFVFMLEFIFFFEEEEVEEEKKEEGS